MRVLVTGASGMLGCNLIPILKDRGYEIVAMVNIGSLRKRPWAKELMDGVQLMEARVEEFKGPLEVDAVLHLAAVLRGPTMRVNYLGTVNLLREVRTDVFVLVSSILALGEVLRVRADEDAPCRPVTGYERSKCEAEREVLRSGMRAIIVRPGWIYGPYSINPDILSIARWIKRGVRPVLVGEDTPLALVHARDVARAMVHLMETGAEGIYNVRGPRMYSMGELLNSISSFLNREGRRVRIPRGVVRMASRFFDVVRYLDLAPEDVPVRKLQETGFQPEIELEDGMGEALSWARSQGLV
ncbi:MAG: NAD(P)-dependent oxidoreductase [Candidatus Korarchaeota archaeon]|nr:NAD(P)-dependent oxidoreductase [Candidatus Korarchaeota archaeon]